MPIAATAIAVTLATVSLAVVALSLRRQEQDEIRRVMTIVDTMSFDEDAAAS
jgi:hypothetical protein